MRGERMNWGSKMSEHDLKDTELEALFDAGRSSVPEIDPEFLGRLQNDAAGYFTEAVAGAAPASGTGIWSQIRNALGGWAGLGGLVAATCVGFWIGVAQPDGLRAATSLASLLGSDTSELNLWIDTSTLDSLILEEL